MADKCRRCLLSEYDPNMYYKTVVNYVESIPEEYKVEKQEYNNRLNLCGECDNLSNGMCRLCGCFVEVRAIKKNSNCAKSKEIW